MQAPHSHAPLSVPIVAMRPISAQADSFSSVHMPHSQVSGFVFRARPAHSSFRDWRQSPQVQSSRSSRIAVAHCFCANSLQLQLQVVTSQVCKVSQPSPQPFFGLPRHTHLSSDASDP